MKPGQALQRSILMTTDTPLLWIRGGVGQTMIDPTEPFWLKTRSNSGLGHFKDTSRAKHSV